MCRDTETPETQTDVAQVTFGAGGRPEALPMLRAQRLTPLSKRSASRMSAGRPRLHRSEVGVVIVRVQTREEWRRLAARVDAAPAHAREPA